MRNALFSNLPYLGLESSGISIKGWNFSAEILICPQMVIRPKVIMMRSLVGPLELVTVLRQEGDPISE